jgi:phosphohistidine swiveling domain-containing protein
MNNLHESIVRDIKKALDIITTRAISVSISYTVVEGNLLPDADHALEDLILFGTLNGQPQPLMINATFGNWTDKMAEVGLLKGFYVNISRIDLKVKPYDSWNLEVETNLTINIIDLQGVASLNRNATINSLVNLEGLEDPLYPLNTGGQASNFITRTPFNGNFTQLLLTGKGDKGYVYGEIVNVPWDQADDVQDKGNKILVTDNAAAIAIGDLNNFKGIVSDSGINTNTNKPYVNETGVATTKLSNGTKILVDGDNGKVWYIDNFIKHVENSYYNASNNGPSFLDRLENKSVIQSKYSDQTTNIIGLESFVNKYNFYWYSGLSIDQTRTNLDYLYFNISVSVTSGGVKGLDPQYFMIDNQHFDAYNVQDILI